MNDLKNFGIHGPEEVPYVGGNAKMNEFCAAMGLCNLRHLEGEIEKRSRAVAHYRARLEGVPGLQLNPIQEGVRPNNAYFPVVFDGFRLNRDQVFARLAEQGINARKYFYPLTNSFACYASLPGSGTAETPIAAHMADRVLTLPLFADLTDEIVDQVCDIILN